MPRSKPPNLVAAMTACVDLVEACNPDHSPAKRRKLMFRAIGSAIEATGASNDKRQHANATLQLFDEETNMKVDRLKESSLRIVRQLP